MTHINRPRSHRPTARRVAAGVVAAYVHDVSRRRRGSPAAQSASLGSIGPKRPGAPTR